MSRYNIPSKQLEALDTLAELPHEQFSELLAAIHKARPALSVHSFAENTFPYLTSVDKKIVFPIIEVATGLCFIMSSRSTPLEEVLSVVVECAQEDGGDYKFLNETRMALSQRLEFLLREESLIVTTKGRDVITEYERYYCGVRILTDVRPVFNAESESTSAAIIMHNVAIHFHKSREHLEFYVALDASDLEELKNAVLSAEKKYKALQKSLSLAGISVLEPERRR